MAVFGAESSLQILDWSTLISTPKVFLQDAPKEEVRTSTIVEAEQQPTVQAAPTDPVLLAARMQLARDLGRTRFRRRIWIGLAAAIFFARMQLRVTWAAPASGEESGLDWRLRKLFS